MLRSFVFGNNERMKELERRVGAIARSGLPVLIEGPSGTGKEALAELLHDLSGSGAGFTRILCRPSGAIIYPAATANDTADLSTVYPRTQGTVFLKNVHLLSAAGQEQLLAALEQVPGSGEGQSASAARLVSSTTEGLESSVSRGGWNPALYHRLSVYRICLPPLRERREDVPELFDQMVRRAANGHGAAPPATPRLLDALMAYDWPGNLRELQNIARTYVVSVHAEEIIAELRNRSRLTSSASQQQASRSLKDLVKGASQKLESEIILRTLERHQWNRRRAAESLHISYRSLLYKMKTCNLRTMAQDTPEGK